MKTKSKSSGSKQSTSAGSKQSGSQGSSSRSGGGTQAGTPEQHVDAGRQNQKNDNKRSSRGK